MSASAVRMGRAFVEIGGDPKKLFKSLQQANARIAQFASNLRAVGSRVMGAGAAIAAPIALASRQFARFDDAIRATAAVSGASGAELQLLNDKARALGESTSFTAVEVANLMTELGRAGFKPTEINAMTGAVLDLARATGTDATLASGIMAATLRQFSLGAGDAARAADVLTTAANSTFNTVEGLGESLKYAGPVAKSLGMSLEDTVAVLGVLGNVGIQGSEAGTALRRLSVIAAGAGDELQKTFGVLNVDAAGNMKPLIQVLDEINTVTANMPVAERTAKMAQAFGLLGITSANVLSQTAGGVTDLANKLKRVDGEAARTAKSMDAGLGGSVRIALSAVEGLAIAIGDALAPAMQSLLGDLTAMVGGFTKFVKENQSAVFAVAQTTAAVVGAGMAAYALGAALGIASTAAGIVVAALSTIMASTIAVGTAFAGLIVKVLAFKVASLAAAAAAAAAWAAVHLPFVALGVIFAAFAVDLYKTADGLGLVSSTLGGMRSTLSEAARGFLQLRDVGVLTFSEIVDSIKSGDIAGAIRAAMAGLNAAFKIGSSSFLNLVDEWGTNLVNAFDFYISSIPFLRFAGPDKYKFSVFGDSTQGNNANTRADERFAAMNARQANRTKTANEALGNLSASVSARRSLRQAAASPGFAAAPPPIPQPGNFLADVTAAAGGRAMSDAEFAQQVNQEHADRMRREAEMLQVQRDMQAEAAKQAEVVGTFSSSSANGMGFGSSLQQQMTDYAKRTADNTEKIAQQGFLQTIE